MSTFYIARGPDGSPVIECFNPDELYHYGVPGMKWGVRRRMASIGRSTNRIGRLKKRLVKVDAKAERARDRQLRRHGVRRLLRVNKRMERRIDKNTERAANAATKRDRAVYEHRIARQKSRIAVNNRGINELKRNLPYYGRAERLADRGDVINARIAKNERRIARKKRQIARIEDRG